LGRLFDGEEAVNDLKLIDAIYLAVTTNRLPVGGRHKSPGMFVYGLETTNCMTPFSFAQDT
jgi:hypothetical protein